MSKMKSLRIWNEKCMKHPYQTGDTCINRVKNAEQRKRETEQTSSLQLDNCGEPQPAIWNPLSVAQRVKKPKGKQADSLHPEEDNAAAGLLSLLSFCLKERRHKEWHSNRYTQFGKIEAGWEKQGRQNVMAGKMAEGRWVAERYHLRLRTLTRPVCSRTPP